MGFERMLNEEASRLIEEVFECRFCDGENIPFVRSQSGKFYRFPPLVWRPHGDETPFTWPGWRCGGWRRRVLRFASDAEERSTP